MEACFAALPDGSRVGTTGSLNKKSTGFAKTFLSQFKSINSLIICMKENKISHKVIRELVASPTPSQTEAVIPSPAVLFSQWFLETPTKPKLILESEDKDENNLYSLFPREFT